MKHRTGKYFFLKFFLLLDVVLLISGTNAQCSLPPFRGAGGQTPPSGGAGGVKTGGAKTGEANTIKIGLLIQTSSSVEARNGAQMAVDEANKTGGFKGRKFELVVKSMEGTWGTGSKQAVDMIFKDNVIAILGSHDGRNAHLVEQATTKAHVTFLSAWAGDQTLSQAFTPWFFSCIPGDNTQAPALVQRIKSAGYKNITLVSDEDYDAKSGYKRFLFYAGKVNLPEPVTLEPDRLNPDYRGICEKIVTGYTDCLVLYTSSGAAGRIISLLKDMKFNTSIYGPLSLLREGSPVYFYPEIMGKILQLSGGDWFKKKQSAFASEYHKKHGSWPGAEAAYSYDGIRTIIESVSLAGGIREDIHKAMLKVKIKGVTGSFGFDDKGNRIPLQ